MTLLLYRTFITDSVSEPFVHIQAHTSGALSSLFFFFFVAEIPTDICLSFFRIIFNWLIFTLILTLFLLYFWLHAIQPASEEASR